MTEKSKKIRPEKQAMQSEMSARLEGSEYVLLVNPVGMTMEQTSDLRQRLRAIDARFNVAQNALLRRTAQLLAWDSADSASKGPTAMVAGCGEITEAAKILKMFTRDSKMAEAKGGWMNGKALSAADVIELAEIPPREVLLGKMLGTLIALPTRLAGVFNSKVSSLLYVLKAVENKKAEAQG